MGISFHLNRPSKAERALLERACPSCQATPGTPGDPTCPQCNGQGGDSAYEAVYWADRARLDGTLDLGGARAAAAFLWLGVSPSPDGEIEADAALSALQGATLATADPRLAEVRAGLIRLAEMGVAEGVSILWD